MTDRKILDQASLTKEVHLILALLNSGSPDETARKHPQLFTEVNWDLFVEPEPSAQGVSLPLFQAEQDGGAGGPF